MYRPLVGSSCIKTAKKIVHEHAVVFVTNLKDNLCFVWSVVALLHPAEHHANRSTNNERFLNEINITDFVFPLSFKHIPKCALLNAAIRITALAYYDDEKDFIPLMYYLVTIDSITRISCFSQTAKNTNIH